uniref:hypothetical protein n=1 Tax=Micromonospora carbonacea TaxID=47853 RepID=UPI003B2221DC
MSHRIEQLRAENNRRQREAEDQVLAGADRLRDDDNSPTAQLVREVAQDIREHRAVQR